MTTAPKQSISYDKLGSVKDGFLGHRFVDNDDSVDEIGTDSEHKSEEEDVSTALDPIMDDAADVNNKPLIEALNGNNIAENEDCDINEPADEVDNQLPVGQPKEQKFKTTDVLSTLVLTSQMPEFTSPTKIVQVTMAQILCSCAGIC